MFQTIGSTLLKKKFATFYLNIFFFFGLDEKRIAMNIYNKSLLSEDTLSLAA